ncbi:SUMF1/EgtB/PvdO family nonheme iron enzyme [Leptothoe sp. EHU-05/26/07-4]
MGKNLAITVGINHYQNLQPLKYARKDAIDMHRYFEELNCETTFHFTAALPYLSQEEEEIKCFPPNYTTLRRFFQIRFERPFLFAGDNLWFFFAGHGCRYGDQDYLMPNDADPGDVPYTALPLHYITERLRRSGAGNVILFIDACRSVGNRQRDGIGVGQDKQKGVIAIYSCSPAQSSYEIDKLEQGSFTHVLLQSLRLEGADNCATVGRLYQRLLHEVPKLNQEYGRPIQVPYGRIEPPTKLYLVLLPKQATSSDRADLQKNARKAELQGDLNLAKDFWVRVLEVAPGDNEAVEGIGRIAQIKAGLETVQSNSLSSVSKEDAEKHDFANEKSEQVETVDRGWQKALEQFTAREALQPRVVFCTATLDKNCNETEYNQKYVEYHEEELGESSTLILVKIPAGDFLMGSPETEVGRRNRESPQHFVNVISFWMGMHPVTQKQWRAVSALPKVKRKLRANPSRFKGDNRPVERVSWNDAVEFCARLSKRTNRQYRLPSEAEWEYACRAGTETPFHFGRTITSELANYDASYLYDQGLIGIYREETVNVDEFRIANNFGLYGMHGNVWEWCLDPYHKNYVDAPNDSRPWKEDGIAFQRIMRGGSWYHLPRDCRSAFRRGAGHNQRNQDFGFRIVCFSTKRILPSSKATQQDLKDKVNPYSTWVSSFDKDDYF